MTGKDVIVVSEGKSMPIHCIVEVSSSSGSSIGGSSGSGNNRKESSSSTSLTLESALSSGNNNLDTIISEASPNGKVVVEVDDFVIIPAGTPFQDVVTTVLSVLGYPKDIIRQAEGTISLRNWKPLRLDQVCDSPTKTVGDILNDLTNHATLRVLVTRPKGGSTEDLKEKLLRLLLAHSSTLLMGAGCPLDEVTMNQLVKGQWPQNLADDVKRRFDQWYQSLHPGATLGLLESLQHSQPHPGSAASHHLQAAGLIAAAAVTGGAGPIHLPGSGVVGAGGGGGGGGGGHHHHSSNHLVNGAGVGGAGGHHHHPISSSLHNLKHELQQSTNVASAAFIDDEHNHPVFHGLAAQKTRMRTSFDPEMELPKLQQWFAENPHPSRHQIQQYVRELNMLDCRKDRKPLDVNNVIYWFKNARAAQKRNELRYNGLPHHQTFAAAAAAAVHHHQQHGLGAASQHHLSTLHHQSSSSSSSHHQSLLHQQERESSGRPRSLPSSSSHPSAEISNGDSCNNSGGGSSRDSDDQDPEMSSSKENHHREMMEEDDDEDEDPLEIKDSDRVGLRNIKEERNEDDFIQVDVDGGGGGRSGSSNNGQVPSPRDGKLIIGNNNNEEEPKDLSSSKASPREGGAGEDEDDEQGDDDMGRGVESEKRPSSRTDIIKEERDMAAEQELMMTKRVVEKLEVSLDEQGDNSSNPGGDLMMMGDHSNNNTMSSSASPRSSPGISPNHNYDFSGPPSMVNRYHPFFEHPSFMAYRHFNSFNFGPNFPGSNSSAESSAYETALNAARKSLLPGSLVGKPTGGLEIFPDFPQGLSPQLMANGGRVDGGGRGGSGNSGGGNMSGGVASPCDPLSRLRAEELFPSRPATSADIINSIINSNRGEFSPLNLGNHHHGSPHHTNSLGMDERRKRNRTFIDPVTEVVLLENWFKIQTHPSHNLILKYTEELNRMPYRQKFPKLEPKNVQFWFKNRRAKCKRLKMNM